MKTLFIIFGVISLALGVVGIFLPLLPTTPFLLLSATLFMHSSPRMYLWLINNRYLGEYIRNYRENKAIPLHAKISAVTVMWASLFYCIFWVVVAWWWAQLLLACVGIGVTWHILSLKTLRK